MEQPPRPDDQLTRVPAEPESSESVSAAPQGRGRLVALVVASVIGVAGIASAASFYSLRGSGETLTDVIPADTDMVVTAYLDPAASQKVNLFRLTNAFPSLGDEQEVTDLAGGWVDEALRDTGLTSDDLGWVGSQVAITVDLNGVATPSVVVVADVEDAAAADAAMATIRTESGWEWRVDEIDGVSMWTAKSKGERVAMAMLGDLFVASNDPSAIGHVAAASSGDEPSLADDPTYQETVAGLPEARLGLLYLNPTDLLEQLQAISALAPGQVAVPPIAGTGLDATRGMAMSLSAEPDGFAFDSYATIDTDKLSDDQRAAIESGGENGLVGMVPADAVALFAVSNIDAGIQQALDQASAGGLDPLAGSGLGDALSSLTGDVVAEVSVDSNDGFPQPAGAIVIGTTDEAAMGQALTQLRDLVGGSIVGSMTSGSCVAPPPGSGEPTVCEDTFDVPASTWVSYDYQGVEISSLDGPPGQPALAYAVFDGAAVLASSQAALKDVIDTAQGAPGLSGTEMFSEASSSVPSGEALAFVDLAAVVAAVDEMSPGEAAEVASLRYFVAGADSDLVSQRGRAFLSIDTG